MWDALAAGHPLPRGYRAVPERSPSGAARDTVRLVRRPWSSDAPAGRTRTVASLTLAARVPLLSQAEDVDPAELLRPGAPEVVPLSEVSLPFRLVSVGGLYPSSPAYPLREEHVLVLESADAALEAWFTGIPEAVPARPEMEWIAAVGDLMLDRGVDLTLLRGDRGLEEVFGDTLPLLRSARIVLGNLESAVTTRTAPAAKAYTFRVAPQSVGALRSAGFTYLSIANNHSFDYGLNGFLDTLECLRSSGIATSGVGAALDQALDPYVVELRGVPLSLWSVAAYPVERTGFDGRMATRATPDRAGVLWADDATLAALASRLSQQPAGLKTVMVHGGEEWQSRPSASQRALYRGLADAGADIVIGSHPHVLQGIEAYHGSLILYSLGNFVFPGMHTMPGAQDSVIALLGVIDGRVVALRLVPVILSGGTVRLASGNAIRERVLVLSRALEAGVP